MRAYKFEAPDVKTREEIFKKLFELVKPHKAFELKDILLMKWDDKDKHVAALLVDGGVGTTFSIVCADKVKGEEKTSTIMVDSDLFAYELEVPKEVKISVEWGEDAVNRYKIVKLNCDKIKNMIQQGVSADEIAKEYGINWTQKDSEELVKREKI